MIATRDYEKGYEDGLRDGFADAAQIALPALKLALDRMELCDYDGDEAESMATVRTAIAKLGEVAP